MKTSNGLQTDRIKICLFIYWLISKHTILISTSRMVVSRNCFVLVCCEDLVLVACRTTEVAPHRVITAGWFISLGQRKFKTLLVLGFTAVSLRNKSSRLKIWIIALMGLDLKLLLHRHSLLSPGHPTTSHMRNINCL